MSRRRTARSPDSLELLLDTICNTFGGVLFIAILVILLLQQTSPNDAPTEIEVTPADIQSLAVRYETAAGELARLRENRRSQQAVIDRFAPVEFRERLSERRELAAQQDVLQEELDSWLARRAELTVEIQEQLRQNDAVRQQSADAREHRDREQALLEEVRQSRVQEVRLPVAHAARGKQEIALILRYGRLYVWHKYGPGNQRLGLNSEDFVVISSDSKGVAVRPKPTRGVSADATPDSQTALKNLLRRFPSQTCYLAIIVRTDSFSQFRHVRDAALQLGLEYRILAVGESVPVSDRGGAGGNVQ